MTMNLESCIDNMITTLLEEAIRIEILLKGTLKESEKNRCYRSNDICAL